MDHPYDFTRLNCKQHNVTKKEVLEALVDVFSADFDMGHRGGNDRLMTVGATRTERLLEIGIEIEGETFYIFHAMNAGKEAIKRSRYERQTT